MVYPTERLPFEELTTIDERVDYVHNQVDYVHNQIVEVQLALNKLLEKAGEAPMAVVTREVPLRATVPKTTGTKIQLPSPLTGRITQIIRHWPPGTNAYVDVAVGHKDTWVLPSETDTFVALDSVTPVVFVSEPVEKGEMLWAIINNTDKVNPHTITVTFIIEGVP